MMPDCKHFYTCSAPLCPKYDKLNQCVWFPGEDICRLPDAPQHTNTQRILNKKKYAAMYKDVSFTIEMLTKFKE